ncbi:hypothetical protein AMATHDRAFT_140692 [Amanita thiersii Skay4041]|uniref:Non-ribosomal peptide synthetase n=1 Tax=Amanita thiersii Skay4041 TaxID=703135 RepID=A0A2A9NPR6_9AGAR|nr:hypothetical protein AMATHDRAFT_140692 [Amanita thiersii Skay4041]
MRPPLFDHKPPVAATLLTARLPQKPPPKRFIERPSSRWIRFQLWFNAYRKFFAMVVTCNAVGLILAITGVWKYAREYTGACVLGNLLMAILMRNELFGRCLYLIVNTLFAKWPPLAFRLACTSVLQHLGGIHSGCAISGFMWLIYRVVTMFIDHRNNHSAVLTAGLVTNIAVAISIVSALPWVRNTHHNVFERHHRFIGWLGLASTWVFVILGDSYNISTHSWNPNGLMIIRQQDFWFAFGMTVFVLIPWFTIREVPVQAEIPSPKVVVLRFERGMQQGLLARISRSSIMEYHAFGIISEGKHAKEHYLICGVQGDFTRKLVENPPTHLWTRELKFAGVSNTSNLYKRGIRVCTGTGLGAALSTCLQSPDWYLIWIGSDQEKTFGPTIAGLIHKLGHERYLLWDSKKMGGRPDTMKLIKEAYAYWKAEVVFITSNWQGNQEMMEGCKEAGIPAFGTLWDF